MLLGTTVQAMAATAPDSVFVVKDGRIVSAYEIGKDVDNITFLHKTVLTGNCVRIGDETVEMKSAVVTYKGSYAYIYLSPTAGLTTVEQIAEGSYLQVAVTTGLLGKNVHLSKFADDYTDNDFLQVMYFDMDKFTNDDNYEPVMFSTDDWSDYFADGTASISMEDGQLSVNFDCLPIDGGQAFLGQYKGGFTDIAQSPYHFTVDGKRMEMRAAFAEKVSDGTAFYLTPGNIDRANDLENSYYYVRLFVPESNMDGSEIDINGQKEYELTFVDNATDVNNPQTISISNGKTGNATGSVSVLKNADGTYDITIDVEGMGRTADRQLQVRYNGEPAPYDLSLPNEFSVAGADPVTLKGAAIKHSDGLYTIYLSTKSDAMTATDVLAADIVVTVPDGFANDDMVHGFSGTSENAMISITYEGTKYCQSTTSGTAAVALGGNAKLTVDGSKINLDFTVFSAKKYSGSIKGHFEGNAAQL